MNLKSLLVLFLSTFITTVSFAQKGEFRNGNTVQKDFYDSIPFEYIKNKIIITVKVSGINKRFIFDTGAVLTLSEEMQEIMQYAKIGSVVVNDVNGKTSDAKIVRVKALQIGSISFLDFASVVMDLKNSYPINCLACDGIIGSNVFKDCIVSIDLGRKLLIVTDNLQKLAVQKAWQSPVSLNAIGKPYIQMNIGNGINFDGLFDSGSDKLMSISDKIFDRAVKKGAASILNEGFGVTSTGINGIAASEKKNRTLIKQVIFGEAAINNAITIESEKTNNAIGIQLAEYGNITLDYINKVFYFVPFKPVQEYKYQKTIGIKDIPDKNFYAIGIVWSNTQAEKLGLKTGFQILKINDQDFSVKSPTHDCLFALTDFCKNPAITLTYKDDKETIKTVELTEQ
jgi:Aspartyl protease